MPALSRNERQPDKTGVLILAVAAVVIFTDIPIVNWEMVARNSQQVLRFAVLGLPVVGAQLLIPFATRKGWRPVAAFIFALIAMVPLVAWSYDPTFSAGALLVLLSSFIAQRRFPGRMPHGAPKRQCVSGAPPNQPS